MRRTIVTPEKAITDPAAASTAVAASVARSRDTAPMKPRIAGSAKSSPSASPRGMGSGGLGNAPRLPASPPKSSAIPSCAAAPTSPSLLVRFGTSEAESATCI